MIDAISGNEIGKAGVLGDPSKFSFFIARVLNPEQQC